MTRRLITTVALLVCATLAPADAQDTPSFAGRWTSDPLPSAGPARGAGAGRGPRSGDMGSGWGSTITVTQDAFKLTVEYAFFSRGDMQAPLKFTYALDGSETKNSVMMGRGIEVETSTATWDGAKLTITTRQTYPSPADGRPMTSLVTRTLSLESPASLLVETTRSAVLGGQPTTAKVTYRKL